MFKSLSKHTGDPTSPACRSVVQSNRVVDLRTPVELGAAGTGRNRIELQRNGDRISAIHVFCRCGEQIVLHCDHDEPHGSGTITP